MGQDSDPPKFFSIFGYEVPVGGIWLSLLVGISVLTAFTFEQA